TTVCADGDVNTQYVRYYSVDNAGNSEAIKTSNLIKIDRQKPATSWDGNHNTWQNFDANIHLTCDDFSGSGCSTTMYRLDTDPTSAISYGEWQTYDINILITQDGNWAIDFNSTDAVGNVGDINTFYVLIDKTPPTTTDNHSDGWHTTDQTIILICNEGSGSFTSSESISTYATLYNGGYKRIAQRKFIDGLVINKLYFMLKKVGSPVGDINFVIRKVSDDSIIQKEVWGNASDLNTDASWEYVSFSNPVWIDEEVRLSVEFNGGDSSNYVKVAIDGNRLSNEQESTYYNSWNDNADYDVLYKIDYSYPASFCSTTYYRIDSGSWQTGTSISITTDGNHQVDYYSTDNAGNSESTKTIWVALDKTPPSTTDDAPSGWQTSDVTVTLTPSDATSGVDTTYYRIDSGSWTTGTSILLDTDGNHQVDYYSTDVAGNTENTHTTWVAVDETPPSVGSTNLIGFLIYGSYIKGTGDINATISDETSGVDTATCEYTTDGGTNWYSASYSNGYCVKTGLTIADGVSYTFNLRGKDIATNLGTGTASSTYTGDLTAPSTSDDYTSYKTWVTSLPTITLSCSDSGAGCKTTQYRVDTDASSGISMGAWQTGTTISFSSDGNYAIDYNSSDNLDNVESTTTKLYILIDTTAPTTTSSGYTNSSWTNTAVTVSLSCDDSQAGVETSGCNTTQYRIDMAGDDTANFGSWQTYSGSFTLSADGNYAIDFNSSDIAGNKETAKREYILIDTIKPFTLAKDFNNYGGVWSKFAQNLVFECSDTNPDGNTVSGCSTIEYAVDTDPTSGTSFGAWQTFDGNVLFADDGNYAIQFKSKDVAGNVEDVNILYVLVDTTPPTAYPKNFSDDATISSRYLIFDVNDAFAGVEDINVLIDGVPSSDFN
ncbi:MAG: hypothetical protein DRO92_04755, partial [Candidatus Altiarchaeales archaeon]